MPAMPITTGSLQPDEVKAWFGAMSVPFGFDATDEMIERSWSRHTLARTTAAYDNGRIVATFGSFPFRTAVPGGELATSGVTAVSVLPTHTRRGITSRLMAEHFDDCRDRGEPLASLWASETVIYGRFGYGLATRQFDLKLTVAPDMFHGDPSDGYGYRLVSTEEARAVIPELFERERLRRPGMFSRSGHWWDCLFEDPAAAREGWSPHRRVVASREGVDVGYVLYRGKWNDSDRQILRVSEAVGSDGAAERAMWHFLSRVDLTDQIVNWNDPIDRPFDFWLKNPRLASRKAGDALYVRLVDVQHSLRGRAYSADGALSVRVVDSVCPWNEGTFRLSVTGGVATVDPITTPPDIEMGAASLASVYLGDRSVAELARVGLVVGDPQSIDLASRMFHWHVAAYCQEMF